MLKIRIQGKNRDIKWFIRLLKKDTRFFMIEPSPQMDIKGTKKYKRVYTQIYRPKEEEAYKHYTPPQKDTRTSIYYGTGRVFGYKPKNK